MPKGLLGLCVEVEQRECPLLADSAGIEDMVSALDREIGLHRASFFERGVRPAGCIQFRLNVAVGDKQKLKRIFCFCLRQQLRCKSRHNAGGAKPAEELPAIEGEHGIFLPNGLVFADFAAQPLLQTAGERPEPRLPVELEGHLNAPAGGCGVVEAKARA